mmetsp:Transcript_50808/g.101118  ORF Transcript_50808/g.101118 Transcript_50808/m.101118 type:complete len:230 (-) Transcript_50808:33-722(-)
MSPSLFRSHLDQSASISCSVRATFHNLRAAFSSSRPMEPELSLSMDWNALNMLEKCEFTAWTAMPMVFCCSLSCWLDTTGVEGFLGVDALGVDGFRASSAAFISCSRSWTDAWLAAGAPVVGSGFETEFEGFNTNARGERVEPYMPGCARTARGDNERGDNARGDVGRGDVWSSDASDCWSSAARLEAIINCWSCIWLRMFVAWTWLAHFSLLDIPSPRGEPVVDGRAE